MSKGKLCLCTPFMQNVSQRDILKSNGPSESIGDFLSVEHHVYNHMTLHIPFTTAFTPM